MTKAEIQLVRALADKRGRTEHGLFVAEGEKLIGELRGSHLKVRKIFALEGVFAGPEVETVAPRDMERLSLLKTAANSLAIVETPRYGLDMRSLAGRLTLALDDVQNPGNLGTIVRLADWFGIADIVCSEASADCFITMPRRVALKGWRIPMLIRPSIWALVRNTQRSPGLG